MWLTGTDGGGGAGVPVKSSATTFAALKQQIATNTGDAKDWLDSFNQWGTKLDADPGA